jgi:hypothetical protein
MRHHAAAPKGRHAMPRDASDPLLLTPGPVRVSRSTKEVMLKDSASGGEAMVAVAETMQEMGINTLGRGDLGGA